MERLTFDGNFCEDIALCGEVLGGSFCEDGTCSQRQIWERLKIIEDVFGDEYDIDRLRELVQTDVVPVVHGKWVDCNWVYECDICSCQVNKGLFKANMRYCPNCGAKMDLID